MTACWWIDPAESDFPNISTIPNKFTIDSSDDMCVTNICKNNAYGKNYYLLVLWVWDFGYLTYMLYYFRNNHFLCAQWGWSSRICAKFWHQIFYYLVNSVWYQIKYFCDQFSTIRRYIGWPTSLIQKQISTTYEARISWKVQTVRFANSELVWDVLIRLRSTTTTTNLGERGGWMVDFIINLR